MSQWNEFKPERDSISFSRDGKEMHILFESNYDGSVYLFLKVEDVLKALKDRSSLQE